MHQELKQERKVHELENEIKQKEEEDSY